MCLPFCHVWELYNITYNYLQHTEKEEIKYFNHTAFYLMCIKCGKTKRYEISIKLEGKLLADFLLAKEWIIESSLQQKIGIGYGDQNEN